MMQDVGPGQVVDTALECAEACDANPSCNIAAFLSELLGGAVCFAPTHAHGTVFRCRF